MPLRVASRDSAGPIEQSTQTTSAAPASRASRTPPSGTPWRPPGGIRHRTCAPARRSSSTMIAVAAMPSTSGSPYTNTCRPAQRPIRSTAAGMPSIRTGGSGPRPRNASTSAAAVMRRRTSTAARSGSRVCRPASARTLEGSAFGSVQPRAVSPFTRRRPGRPSAAEGRPRPPAAAPTGRAPANGTCRAPAADAAGRGVPPPAAERGARAPG